MMILLLLLCGICDLVAAASATSCHIRPDGIRMCVEHAAAATAPPDYSQSRPADLVNFTRWLSLANATYSSVDIREMSSSSRGLFARTHIPAHSAFLSVPKSLLITDSMWLETRSGRQVFELAVPPCNISHKSAVAILLYLLQLPPHDNFYLPYLQVLPQDLSSFPIFWSDREILLQGSPLVDRIRQRIETMAHDHRELTRALGPQQFSLSLEEFMRLRTVVGSRTFGYTHRGKLSALVPLADFVNHQRPSSVSWDFRDDAFFLTTTAPIEAHSQIFTSYGDKDNADFFLFYGFALESNRGPEGKCPNAVPITLAHSSLSPSQQAFLGLPGPQAKRTFRLTVNRDDAGTQAALVFARVACASEDQVAKLARDSALFSDRDRLVPAEQRQATELISLSNEIAAVGLIADACREHLKGYARSLQENAKLSPPKWSREHMALLLLMGEQEMCHFWMRLEDALKRATPLAASERGEPDMDLQRYLSFVDSSLRNRTLTWQLGGVKLEEL